MPDATVTTMDLLPASPLADWLNERVERLGLPAVISEMGLAPGDVGARQLYRYRNCLKSGSVGGVKGEYPTDTYPRAVIERLFSHGDCHVWEVYPELADQGEIHDAFCGTCHEVVTVGEDGVCPWCETGTSPDPPKQRLWCPSCDALVWPRGKDRCWRCHGKVQSVPHEPCGCGCGTLVHRFDPHGRRIKWAHGHAPQSLEKDRPQEVAPFAEWLREEVRRVDPIAAVASQLDLTRAEVIDVIEGRVSEFSRKRIQRALWRAQRRGGGKGAGNDANVPGFFDLYPADARAKVCPGCGGGKAPHAEMCKGCRKKANREERAA